MELDKSRVLEKFRQLSGEEAPEREALEETLCEECAARTAGMARDVPEEVWRPFVPALESLAAAEALYQLALAEEALGPQSVSTPEIKWTAGSRGEKARRLAEEKRKACAPVLKEAGFYFGRA